MIFVSEGAKAQIESIRNQGGISSEHFIRVSVTSGGCSGLSYKMDFDNESQTEDQVFEDTKRLVKERSAHNYKLGLVRLPDLITNTSSFWGYEQSLSKANYITNLVGSGTLVFIDQEYKGKLDQKIVAIPSADPGYDWLFNHNIAGLITQYGGANSHMAIRCAEMNIPAAIGVGEKLYNKISVGSIILDCYNEKIINV